MIFTHICSFFVGVIFGIVLMCLMFIAGEDDHR